MYECQAEFDQQKLQLLTVKSPVDGKVTTWQLREKLIQKPVGKGEILLTVALKTDESQPGQPMANYYSSGTSWQDTVVANQPVLSAKSTNSPSNAADKRANELAAQYRRLSESPEKWEVDVHLTEEKALEALQPLLKNKEDLKADLRTEVTKAFNERQKAQTAELDGLRKRLNQIETSINNREKNREAIINRRVEELINPDVKWDAGDGPRQTNQPRANDSRLANPPPAFVPTQVLPPSRPAASDAEAILGEWKVESGLEGGKPSEHPPTKMVITKDFLIMTDGKKKQIATYTLDPTKNPKWLDVQPQNYNGNLSKAIYKLQGDELILCAAKEGGNKDERPTAFESKPDSPNYNLAVFKREKPQAATVPASPASPEYDPFAQLPVLTKLRVNNGLHLALLLSDYSLVPPAPDSATAQQSLQGKWSVFIACDEGENRLLDQTNIPPSERLKGCVVEGSTLTFQMEDGTTQTAKFKLDPKHYSSWIDLEIGNRVFKGIYELNPRNATLTICYPEGRTKKRSTGFFSGANSENDVLLVFRRASPAQQAPQ